MTLSKMQLLSQFSDPGASSVFRRFVDRRRFEKRDDSTGKGRFFLSFDNSIMVPSLLTHIFPPMTLRKVSLE